MKTCAITTVAYFQAAVACGTFSAPYPDTATTFSVLSVSPRPTECTEATETPVATLVTPGDPAWCLHCPTLLPSTRYAVIVTANDAPPGLPGFVSQPHVLDVTTSPARTGPAFLTNPFISNITSSSFSLHFAVGSTAQVAYAVTYSRASAIYFTSYSLDFSIGALSADDVIRHAVTAPSSSPRAGGVVAAGLAEFQGGAPASVVISPECLGSACHVAENSKASMLSPDTEYKVWVVAAEPSAVSGYVPGGNIGAGELERGGGLGVITALICNRIC
jgi:hypothetical protein